MNWLEVQEGILLVFGPVLFWWLMLISAAGIFTIVGVLFLEVTARMTR